MAVKIKFKDAYPTFADYDRDVLAKVRRMAPGGMAWLQDDAKFYTMEGIYHSFIAQYGERVLLYPKGEFEGYFSVSMIEYLPMLYVRSSAIVEDKLKELRTNENVGVGSTITSISDSGDSTTPAGGHLDEYNIDFDKRNLKKYTQDVVNANRLTNAISLSSAKITGEIKMFLGSFNELFMQVITEDPSDQMSEDSFTTLMNGLIQLTKVVGWVENNFTALLRGNRKIPEYGTELDWANRVNKQFGDAGYLLDSGEIVIYTTLGEKRLGNEEFINNLITQLREQLRQEIQENKIIAYRGRYNNIIEANLGIDNPVEGDWVLAGADAPYDMYIWGANPDGVNQWLHAGQHQLGTASDDTKLDADLTNLTQSAITKLIEKLAIGKLTGAKNYFSSYDKSNGNIFLEEPLNFGEYEIEMRHNSRKGGHHRLLTGRLIFKAGEENKFFITAPVRLRNTLVQEGFGTGDGPDGPVNFMTIDIEIDGAIIGGQVKSLKIGSIEYFDVYAARTANVMNGATVVSLKSLGAGIDVKHWLFDTLEVLSITPVGHFRLDSPSMDPDGKNAVREASQAGKVILVGDNGLGEKYADLPTGGAHPDDHAGTHSETDFDKTKLVQYDPALHTEIWADGGDPTYRRLKSGHRLFYSEDGATTFEELKSGDSSNLQAAATSPHFGFQGDIGAFTLTRIEMWFNKPAVAEYGSTYYPCHYTVAYIVSTSAQQSGTNDWNYNIEATRFFVLPPTPKGGV